MMMKMVVTTMTIVVKKVVVNIVDSFCNSKDFRCVCVCVRAV